MAHMNALRVFRRKWALSQREVARLVGLKSRSGVSNHELQKQLPALRTALAYQIVFGAPLGVLFPKSYREIEDEVLQRAVELDEAYRHRTDANAKLKRAFLTDLVSRVASDDFL